MFSIFSQDVTPEKMIILIYSTQNCEVFDFAFRVDTWLEKFRSRKFFKEKS
jgi:hypothetical protein